MDRKTFGEMVRYGQGSEAVPACVWVYGVNAARGASGVWTYLLDHSRGVHVFACNMLDVLAVQPVELLSAFATDGEAVDVGHMLHVRIERRHALVTHCCLGISAPGVTPVPCLCSRVWKQETNGRRHRDSWTPRAARKGETEGGREGNCRFY